MEECDGCDEGEKLTTGTEFDGTETVMSVTHFLSSLGIKAGDANAC